uniref:Uncharacterized protein n=1 Tax=Rhizophora mucronata TaxID=61149 RepID=A0A2P2N3B9_RHIMU
MKRNMKRKKKVLLAHQHCTTVSPFGNKTISHLIIIQANKMKSL